MKIVTWIATVIILLAGAGIAASQQRGFIPVGGNSLRERLDTAMKMGQGRAQQERFWAAYSFDVRSGFAIDTEIDFEKNKANYSLTPNVPPGSSVETRNLGVFLLFSPGGSSAERVEVFNLDKRGPQQYPVYWLGRADIGESLDLLRSIANEKVAAIAAERAVTAIGLHNDMRVASLLKDFIRSSQSHRVRIAALTWLGAIKGEESALADIIRDEHENSEIRKQAVFAIALNQEAQSLSLLRDLYPSVSGRELKKQILLQVSYTGETTNVVDFLTSIAISDPDRELKKYAVGELGLKKGEQSIKALIDVAYSPGGDFLVQKQAVTALAAREKNQSVPALIKVASDHPNRGMRKQAMTELGNFDDDRAREFLMRAVIK